MGQRESNYYKMRKYAKVLSQFIHLHCSICYEWLPATDWWAVIWCTSISRTIDLLALTWQSRPLFKPTSIRRWEIALHSIKQHCPVTVFAIHRWPNGPTAAHRYLTGLQSYLWVVVNSSVITRLTLLKWSVCGTMEYYVLCLFDINYVITLSAMIKVMLTCS